MPEIIWNDSLQVGITEIDAQHERLITMINELYYAYMNGVEQDVLSKVITGVSDYTAYHFSTEERLMEEYGYPHAEEHIAQHREFTRRSIDFLMAHVEGKEELSAEVIDYLTDWWMGHINDVDRRLAHALKSKGVA